MIISTEIKAVKGSRASHSRELQDEVSDMNIKEGRRKR